MMVLHSNGIVKGILDPLGHADFIPWSTKYKTIDWRYKNVLYWDSLTGEGSIPLEVRTQTELGLIYARVCVIPEVPSTKHSTYCYGLR